MDSFTCFNMSMPRRTRLLPLTNFLIVFSVAFLFSSWRTSNKHHTYKIHQISFSYFYFYYFFWVRLECRYGCSLRQNQHEDVDRDTFIHDTDNISINLPSIDRSHDALDCARCESAENETPCLRQPRLLRALRNTRVEGVDIFKLLTFLLFNVLFGIYKP